MNDVLQQKDFLYRIYPVKQQLINPLQQELKALNKGCKNFLGCSCRSWKLSLQTTKRRME